MMTPIAIQLQPVEEGAFLAFTEDMLAHMGVGEGDSVLVTIDDDGTVRMQKATPESEQTQAS